MTWEPVAVSARWNMDGRFVVRQFRWRDVLMVVESTGRQWEEADGVHILCMVAGQGVVELRFQTSPTGWQIRTPRQAQAA